MLVKCISSMFVQKEDLVKINSANGTLFVSKPLFKGRFRAFFESLGEIPLEGIDLHAHACDDLNVLASGKAKTPAQLAAAVTLADNKILRFRVTPTPDNVEFLLLQSPAWSNIDLFAAMGRYKHLGKIITAETYGIAPAEAVAKMQAGIRNHAIVDFIGAWLAGDGGWFANNKPDQCIIACVIKADDTTGLIEIIRDRAPRFGNKLMKKIALTLVASVLNRGINMQGK